MLRNDSKITLLGFQYRNLIKNYGYIRKNHGQYYVTN